MLSTHKIKILQSLDKKKFRQKYNLFLVEGNKTIRELKDSPYSVEELYTTGEIIPDVPADFSTQITEQELKKISFLQHPKDSVAVCRIPESREIPNCHFNIVLDGLQDPGNFGTIIRLADWFGIQQIVCSEDTVDLYNPKVIQASMGSFARVNVFYTSLPEFLQRSNNINVGTDMTGKNIYKTDIPTKINLVLGNEGNGMRPETVAMLHRTVCIPRFGESRATESLNVSIAAGIILGEIFSRQ